MRIYSLCVAELSYLCEAYLDTFAVTNVDRSLKGNDICVKIGKRDGTYNNASDHHSYELRFPATMPPVKVIVDGKEYPMPVTLNPALGATRVCPFSLWCIHHLFRWIGILMSPLCMVIRLLIQRNFMANSDCSVVSVISLRNSKRSSVTMERACRCCRRVILALRNVPTSYLRLPRRLLLISMLLMRQCAIFQL